MNPDFWRRLSNARLTLDQTDTPLEIDRAQVEEFYAPLAASLTHQAGSLPRWMVAVAGPPGSGKTAFAALLAAVINAAAGSWIAISIGQDGWHYPNAYLDSQWTERAGEQVLLRRIKGAPETFAAISMYRCLAAIRQGGRVPFPVYSRSTHEPVPGAGTVEPGHRIVIVEGNYLLLDEDPWREFQKLFDVCIYLKADPETLLAGLRARHLRGGKSVEVVERQLREVDLPNAQRVMAVQTCRHSIVHKSDSKRIAYIEWLSS